MFGYHRIGLWDVTLVVVVLFIVFGHKLPGLMRRIGREGVEAAQHLPLGEQRAALFTFLMIRLFLTGVAVLVACVCLILLISVVAGWE